MTAIRRFEPETARSPGVDSIRSHSGQHLFRTALLLGLCTNVDRQYIGLIGAVSLAVKPAKAVHPRAITGNDLWHTYCVAPSQSPIELTFYNEPLFKYRCKENMLNLMCGKSVLC